MKKKENPLWLNDAIQFPRLIAEAQAVGVFTLDNIDKLSEAMDLDHVRVFELIDRACKQWDFMKALSGLEQDLTKKTNPNKKWQKSTPHQKKSAAPRSTPKQAGKRCGRRNTNT